MENYLDTNHLYHHGILGQKWGVRRFQNKDGSLTSAGKKRYNDDVADAKVKVDETKLKYKETLKSYNKKTAYGSIVNNAELKKLNSAERNYRYAKQDFADIKIKNNLNNETKKSKHQLELEKKYAEKGMTSEEAAIAAYKRIRTEKAIAITAGVTVAAAAAYIAYKHYDNTVDKIIKSDTLLQNISTNGNKGVADAFYASMTKSDNLKYRGLYGQELKSNVLNQNKNVFETKIRVNSKLKVASPKNAENVLNDLVKSDNVFAKSLKNNIQSWSNNAPLTDKQASVFKKAVTALNSGKIDKNVYDALNLSLTDHSPEGQYLSDRFYNALKSKGYDAIKDINDAKYSGYNSKNPIIVFNGIGKTAVDSIRNVRNDEIDAAAKKANGLLIRDSVASDLAKKGSAYLAVGLGITAANTISTNAKNDKIVKKYRDEHPNTELSYKEIVRMYENSK